MPRTPLLTSLVQFRSRLWSDRGPWGVSTGSCYTDLPFQSCWDGSRAQPGTSGLLVGYSGGPGVRRYAQGSPYSAARHVVSHESIERFVREIGQVFPGASAAYNGKGHLSLPYKDPLFGASYSYYRPGQYHRFGGEEGRPEGPVHFAGEHCSQDFQGFMEGAASEGVRAANEILRALRKEARR